MQKGWVLAAVLVVAGCKGGFSKSATTAANGKARDEMVWAIPSAISGLDPQRLSDVSTGEVMIQVINSLFEMTPEGLKPVLAESSEVSPDGKIVTVKLKKGVKFSNGHDFDAEDVAFSYNRAVLPTIFTPGTDTALEGLQGLKEAMEGKAKLKGLETPDSHTVVFYLDSARPRFAYQITALPILDSEATPPSAPITKPEDVVGTGPYRIASYTPGGDLVLEASPNATVSQPLLKKVTVRAITDAATRLNSFRQGSIDLTDVDRADIPAVKEDAKLAASLKMADMPIIGFVYLNPKLAPAFRDERVRHALSLAIDRTNIAETVLAGGASPLYGLVPRETMPDYPPTPEIGFDAAQARKLLADAGYPEGKGIPPLTLTTIGRYGRDAEAIVTGWRQSLGIEAKVLTLELNSLVEKMQKKQVPLGYMYWTGSYGDAENFLPLLLGSKSGNNIADYANPSVDESLAQAPTRREEAQRVADFVAAEKQALADAYYLPVIGPKRAELVRDGFDSVRCTAVGRRPFAK